MRRKSWLVLLAAPLALAACTPGPHYLRPQPTLPEAFSATPEQARAAWPDAGWWSGFAVPELDALIARARANSDDLAAAAARVRQADATARIAGAALLPSLSLGGSGSYTHEGVAKASGSTRGISSASSVDVRSYSVGPDASWSLDFWGHAQSLTDADLANAVASRFDQAVVALTVVTSVATEYFTALGYGDRLTVAEQNLADAENLLEVFRARLAAGTATALDVAQEETLVAQQRAAIPSLRIQRDQAIIALGILTGQPPENIHIAAHSLDGVALPPVAPGLPSDLLARRPDVAEAEAQLIAANANIRAARAAFYPSISLTGSGGWQSTALSTLFGPGAFFATLAGSVTQPIFDGGQRSGQLALNQGQYDELLADYRKAILQAFTDVENALTALRNDTEDEDLQRRAMASARNAVLIARAQLDAGTVDVTTLLSVQTSLYTALDNLAQVRLARISAVVSLYKALGGGWQRDPNLVIPGSN